MASMKLCKPSFNYGASQRNFSKYEHQEHHQKSQSSHAEHGWATKPNHGSSYYGQAKGSQMGQASYAFHEDDLGHSWANGSTNYHGQAQIVLPTLSTHVQQAQHVREQESHVGQEWNSNGSKCSSPARTNPSVAMMAKMEHGWTNKANHCSSPTRVSEYGASMYQGHGGNAYQYTGNGINSGWASKPTSSNIVYGQREQHGWTGGSTKYPSSVETNHSSVAMHKDEHMIGKMDQGWAASPTKISTPSTAMHNEGHMMGKMYHGWAGSPIETNHSSVAMHKEEHMMGKMNHGWGAGATKANQSGYSMHEEDRMMGKMDHAWAGSPTKANHTSLAMRKEEQMIGKMDHGWVASPTKANHSSLSMHNEEHMMGQVDHGYAASNPMNQSSHAMYKGQEHHGWAGKNGHSYGSAHSAHGSYDHHGYGGHEDVNDIMDEILTKYPAHNLRSGHGNWAAKPCASMNHSQASMYAKQKAWAGSSGSGNHGSSAQSMAWSERKEREGAYLASSNVGKYGMSPEKSNGGICIGNIGVGRTSPWS